MISIKDNKLYQWDTARVIMCTPPEGMRIDEIHVDNHTRKNAIVLDVYEESEYICANIPDVCLQKPHPLHVYAVMKIDGEENTIESATFTVIPRKKPEDYVYEEEEILRYSKLEEQINALNEKVDNLTVPEIKVDDSLSEESTNPVQNKVVTEAVQGIEKKIDDIEIPEVQQTDSELSETSTNPIQNKAVTEAIKAVEEKVESVDLSKKFTAVPGQVVRVKAVDENGNPTEWEATDITSGEENVQSDLSENDENSAAYVKNRTHWVEEKIVLSETNVVRGPNGVEFSYVIEEGKTYTIKFNGEIYNCKAKSSEIPETLTIGNASLMIGEDTGEPFCIGAKIGDTEAGVVFNNLFEDTTVSIVLEEYHPLSPKFLPNGGVTSWNDLTDRPFYEEQMVVFEQTVDCTSDMDGAYLGTVKNPPFIPSNQTYIVTWNGTKYTCNAIDAVGDGSVYAIGNAGFLGGNMTEEPFLITEDNGMLAFVTLESGSYDVKIEEVTVKKIEEKFLPDMPNVTVVNGEYIDGTNDYFSFNLSLDEMQEIVASGGAVLASVLHYGDTTRRVYEFDGYHTFIRSNMSIVTDGIQIHLYIITKNNDGWLGDSKSLLLT